MSPLSIEAIKLVGMHNKRIISLYSGALKYFKDDVLLWKKYISFLVEIVSGSFFFLVQLFHHSILYCARITVDR